MERRGFLAAALAAVAGCVAGLCGHETAELALVERFDGRQWMRVRMSQLRPGDRFRTGNAPGHEFLAVGPPVPTGGPEVCTIEAEGWRAERGRTWA